MLHSVNLKIAVIALALGALGAVPASAAVAPGSLVIAGKGSVIKASASGMAAPSSQSLGQSAVEQVQRRGSVGRSFRGGRSFGGRGFRGGRYYSGRAWRGGRYYRPGWRGGRYWYGRRWVGPAIVAGTAALIIGGSIAESRASYGDRWERCADRFQSFRWSDGTYQPYGDNPRRLCPYLRR